LRKYWANNRKNLEYSFFVVVVDVVVIIVTFLLNYWKN